MDLPLTDFNGVEVQIPFYVTLGVGPLLLGNNVLSKANVLGEKNLLVIPPNVLRNAKTRVFLPTYTLGSKDSLRTLLHVVSSQVSKFSSFFSTLSTSRPAKLIGYPIEQISFFGTQGSAKHEKWFASKLHVYSHFRPKDMIELCRRAKILTPTLKKELQDAFANCTSCLQSGRPLNSRKFSLSRVLSSFNDHLQIDFFFIQELGNLPILCMVDVATGYASTVLMSSRDLDQTARFVEVYWFNVYGPPRTISGDPEMHKGPFKELLSRHNCEFAARPARRHNKIGSVEASHRSIRIFVQRLLLDAEYIRNTSGVSFSDFEILSRATFLKNALYGCKSLSSFELARRYSPSSCGAPQAPVSVKMFEAHQEQAARRAIHKLLASPSNKPVSQDLLPPKTPVYFYVRGTNKGKWELGFFKRALGHLVQLCRNSSLRGHALQVAYEDIRLAPRSSLLYALDQLELDSSLPAAFIQGKFNVANVSESQDEVPEQPLVGDSSAKQASNLASNALGNDSMAEECSLWKGHPFALALSSTQRSAVHSIEKPSMDVGTPCSVFGDTEKDIGCQIEEQSNLTCHLESDEQAILRKSSRCSRLRTCLRSTTTICTFMDNPEGH